MGCKHLHDREYERANMKIYEEPIVTLLKLGPEDVLTSSDNDNVMDDIFPN